MRLRTALSRGFTPPHRIDLLKLVSNPASRRPHIELVLQVQPKLGRGAERLAEPQRGIGCDRGLFIGNAFDAGARNATRLCKCTCRQAERNEKLLPQHFAGMHRREFSGHEFSFSSVWTRGSREGTDSNSAILPLTAEFHLALM